MHCCACAWGGNMTSCRTQVWVYNSPALHGTLPASWGSHDSLPALTVFSAANCSLTGDHPPAPLPAVTAARCTWWQIDKASAAGSVPLSWGNDSSVFALLQEVDVRENHGLTGVR